MYICRIGIELEFESKQKDISHINEVYLDSPIGGYRGDSTSRKVLEVCVHVPDGVPVAAQVLLIRAGLLSDPE